MRSWVGFVVAVALLGCDDGAAKGGAGDAAHPVASSAAPKAETPPAPKVPDPPRAPAITVDDRGCTIDGTAFTGAEATWRDQASTLLAGKPLVAGEAVVVNVMRDTKLPKVEAIVVALTHAKAKSAVVRTPMRDQSTGELTLALEHPALPDCSAAAMIEHDGAVAVWSKAGSGAQRFARGMAGPDLTSSTEALRKHAAGCDSPAWLLGAADGVTWGLAFDLAMRAKGGAEAGGTLRPTEAVLMTRAPTPGRRVEE
jgi:hypothetical protein